MELDTKKKKYKLSASTTPSPSEENKSFSNGFYHKNITGFEGEPSTTNGKGTPAFDNLAYASHDDDNVFKPKTDIYFDPSSLQRNQKGHLSRVESAREDNVPKKERRKGMLDSLVCVDRSRIVGWSSSDSICSSFQRKVFQSIHTSTCDTSRQRNPKGCLERGATYSFLTYLQYHSGQHHC